MDFEIFWTQDWTLHLIGLHHHPSIPLTPTPPLTAFIKGGWDFSKMALMAGMGNFAINGWEPGIRGDGKISRFLLHSWQSDGNPHYFMKTFLYSQSPLPFSNFVQPHPHCSFCCPVCLAKWGYATFDVLFYLMIT